jgi:hypothetical protein
MTKIIRMVRDIYNRKGCHPIEVGELLSQMNKKELVKISKEELVDALNYYKRLQVVYVNNDQQVIFL